jgi:hypothetical protein
MSLNPIDWSARRKVAGVLFVILGALAGIIVAWLGSPFRALSLHSLSGEWADYPQVFLNWLSHPRLYWPWPVFGSAAAAIGFYAVVSRD